MNGWGPMTWSFAQGARWMSPPTRATDSSLGSLAHYQLQAKLGEGAMGTVYRARNTRTGGLVAIKVIHPHLQHVLRAR
jgi:serine/threonine protein kinase